MSFLSSLKENLGFRGQTSYTEDYQEYYTISPQQEYYEIILIRPKTLEDMDYVYDQIVEEKNPVIIDLGFLHRKGRITFNAAGERVKELRDKYECESILLSQESGKYLFILSPKRVKLQKK